MKSKLLLAAVLFLVAALFGTPQASAEIHKITAEGYYEMGDADTRETAKKKAVEDAMRIAVQKAGTYIESITEVKQHRISKDEIIRISASIIRVLAQSVTYDTENKWICHAIVNAEIDDSDIDIDKILASRRKEKLERDQEVQRLKEQNRQLEFDKEQAEYERQIALEKQRQEAEQKRRQQEQQISGGYKNTINGSRPGDYSNARLIILDARSHHDWIEQRHPICVMGYSSVVKGEQGTIAVCPEYFKSAAEKRMFEQDPSGGWSFWTSLKQIPKFQQRAVVPVLFWEQNEVGEFNPVISESIAMELPELPPSAVAILY